MLWCPRRPPPSPPLQLTPAFRTYPWRREVSRQWLRCVHRDPFKTADCYRVQENCASQGIEVELFERLCGMEAFVYLTSMPVLDAPKKKEKIKSPHAANKSTLEWILFLTAARERIRRKDFFFVPVWAIQRKKKEKKRSGGGGGASKLI